MTLDESKRWLADHWVLHPAYRAAGYPHHSAYAAVDVRVTFMLVRHRMRVVGRPVTNIVGPYLNPAIALASERTGSEQNSFSSAVEQTKQRLRMVHGRVA